MIRGPFTTVVCLAIATLAVTLLLPAAVQGAPAAGPGGPGDHALGTTGTSGLASGSDVVRSSAALEHEYDDREHVDERAEVFHFSAVGGIFDDTPYEQTGERVGHTATGVLVSDQHVLTAAHVVTDDSGAPQSEKDYWFAPGMTEIDGETTLYHGRAKVEAIHVDPEYDGDDDNADDVALLTLDRPIGGEAGHFDLAAIDDESAWGDQFYFLGYPGDDQLRQGDAEGHEYRSKSSSSHVIGAEIDHGDSGGPLFKNPGDPHVYSVVSGITTLADAEIVDKAAPITVDRREWLENRMAEDDRSRQRPELYRADRVAWVDDGTQSTPAEITPTDAGTFETTLYNGGGIAGTATVEFYLYEGEHSVASAPDRDPVCTATVSVPHDDTATASCSGKTGENVDEAGTYSVFPVFDAVEPERSTTTEREYYSLGSTATVPRSDGSVSLADVDAPAVADLGAEFDVTATVANDAEYDRTATLQFGTDDETDGEPYEATVTVPAGGEEEHTVPATMPADAAGEELTLTVLVEGDAKTVEVTGAADGEAYVSIEDVLVFKNTVRETPIVDEEATVKIEYSNLREAGDATVRIDTYGPDGEEHLDLIASEVAAFPTGSQEATFDFTPDRRYADGATIVVTAEPGTRAEQTTAVDWDEPPVTIDLEAVRDPVLTTAEVVTVGAVLENDGEAAASTEFALAADDGGSVSTDVALDPGESERLSVDLPIDPVAGSDLTITTSTARSSDERTVDVAEAPELTLDGQYEPKPAGDDGLYRDVNGDGSVSNSDVTTFFSKQHLPAWDERVTLFDFDSNDDVGQSDVIELFEYVNG